MPYTQRENKLLQAFISDNWDCQDPNKLKTASYNGKFGIAVQHKTARTGQGNGPFKKAYYVEGSPEEMGHLMGLLAEEEIATMSAPSSIHEILKSFTESKAPDPILRRLETMMLHMSNQIRQALTKKYPQIEQEFEKMVEGCKVANNATNVSIDRLWQLNVGFDALLSYVYTKAVTVVDLLKLFREDKGYKLPLMCNAFSVYGGPPGNRFHFMGRDFMFSTGNIMQKYIAPIIYRPEPDGNLFVGISAPGLLGCFTAMNANGVAIGVDMSPAGNCDEAQPGLNSLLLNRDAVQNGTDLQGAINRIVDAPRGVSWIHILADGSADQHSACIVESGKRYEDDDHFRNSLLTYPHYQVMHTLNFEGRIPPVDGIWHQLMTQPPTTQYRKGLMIREPDFRLPAFYQDFNKPLIENFRDATTPPPYRGIPALGDNDYSYKHFYNYQYDEKDWHLSGFINRTVKDNNCPMSYYFPPIRNEWNDQRTGNILVATNFFMIPEMRLCQMHPDSSIIAQDQWDDIQWRYVC